MPHPYGSEYAGHYAQTTLKRPYTEYKNDLVAKLCSNATGQEVLDIGGNVNGLFKERGLRQALEKHGMDYVGLDLDPSCFSPDAYKNIGQDFDAEMYPDVAGVVGDARAIPFADESFSAVTCNDVIEHVEDPERVIAEAGRVLVPDGRAVMVVPSLYKLDGLSTPWINDIRVSSHVNRFGLDTWIQLMQSDARLHIDEKESRPMGIASGLTYLLWADPYFVPHREGMNTAETYSDLSRAHKGVKQALGEYDEVVDEFYLTNNTARNALLSRLITGSSIEDVYDMLAHQVGSFTDDNALKDLLDLSRVANITDDRYSAIQNVMNASGDLAMGNSAVFVLHKSVE